jgi:hypothetical protein
MIQTSGFKLYTIAITDTGSIQLLLLYIFLSVISSHPRMS